MFQMHVHVVCVMFFVVVFFFSKRIIAVLTPRIPSLDILFEVAKCSLCIPLEKNKSFRLEKTLHFDILSLFVP